MDLISLLAGIILGVAGIGISIYLYRKTTEASDRLERATSGIDASVRRLLQAVEVFEDVYHKLVLAEQVTDLRRLCLYLVVDAARAEQGLTLEDVLVAAELRGWGELSVREAVAELRTDGLIEVDPRPQRTSVIAPSRRLLASARSRPSAPLSQN